MGHPSGTRSMHSTEEGTPHPHATPTPPQRTGKVGQSQEVLIPLRCTPVGTKAATEPASGGLAVVQRVSLQDPRGGSELGESHRTRGPPCPHPQGHPDPAWKNSSLQKALSPTGAVPRPTESYYSG